LLSAQLIRSLAHPGKSNAMPDDASLIQQCLAAAKTIAIVGLSVNAARPSFGVARYLQQCGYRIIPINPAYAGTHILGERCYSSLQEATESVQNKGVTLDIVDIFRKSEEAGTAVDAAIGINARCVWLQLGVVDDAATARAERAGLLAVCNKCIKIEHMQLFP